MLKDVSFNPIGNLSHGFYGSDPTDKTVYQFLSRAAVVDRVLSPNVPGMNLWRQSYRAAHEARLLTHTLAVLNQQHVNVLNWLAAVQAQEQAQIETQRLAAEAARNAQEAQRQAAEAARKVEEARQEALRMAAEATRKADEERRQAAEAARKAEEARQEALRMAAEAVRKAEEEQRQAAEAARKTQEARQEASRLAAKAAREARKAKAREKYAAKKRAKSDAETKKIRDWLASLEAARTERRFPILGSAVASAPVFTVASGRLATHAGATQAINIALRTAIRAVIAAGAASAGAVLVGFAALLIPSPLGNSDGHTLNGPLSDLVPDELHDWTVAFSSFKPDDLHAISIPLSALAPVDIDGLYDIALAEGEIALPVAIGSRTVDNTTEFFVAATNGTTVPSNVPVRIATLDPGLNAYRSYNPDAPSIGMTWTPIVTPDNASTVFPPSAPNIVVYDGTTVAALEGRIDTHPEFDLYSFGGFITVFPAESGIPPVFTMFRDRRNEPGVVSGFGQEITGTWLNQALQKEGAPIPKAIADQLRGREFARFKSFRRAFWRAVANDETLIDQFTQLNKIDLRDGLSPSALPSEQVGRRKVYEIHHIHPIGEGGAVFDIDNLRVLTPRQHIQTHSKKGK